MKLSLEDKKEIVRMHEEDGLGYKTIAKKANFDIKIVRTIILRYKEHGIETLKHPLKMQKYSADFKFQNITPNAIIDI